MTVWQLLFAFGAAIAFWICIVVVGAFAIELVSRIQHLLELLG